MLELISPPYLNLSPKLLEQRKRKLPPPQIKTYVSAHTQRFCALDINKQNIFSCLLEKKMHTHTHHQPDIHQAISQLHKIKRSSFCPFPLPPALSQSKNPASNFLSWGALWGPRRGKCLGSRRSRFSRHRFLSVPVKWTLAYLAWLLLWGSSGRQGGE